MKKPLLRTLGWLSLLFAWPAIAHSTSPFGEQIKDFGGATMLTPRWLSVADYPRGAVEGEIQGRVVVAFNINAKGRVENCQVKSSSGHLALDVVPCRALQRKARFVAPVDDDGTSQTTSGMLSVDFWMPE
jgi:protein TonB